MMMEGEGRLINYELVECYEDYHIMKQKYDQLLDDFTRLEDNFASLADQFDEGKQVFVAQRDRIAILESDLNRCQDRFENVDSEVASLEAELLDVLGALSDKQDDVAAARLQIRELEAQIDTLLTPRKGEWSV